MSFYFQGVTVYSRFIISLHFSVFVSLRRSSKGSLLSTNSSVFINFGLYNSFRSIWSLAHSCTVLFLLEVTYLMELLFLLIKIVLLNRPHRQVQKIFLRLADRSYAIYNQRPMLHIATLSIMSSIMRSTWMRLTYRLMRSTMFCFLFLYDNPKYDWIGRLVYSLLLG